LNAIVIILFEWRYRYERGDYVIEDLIILTGGTVAALLPIANPFSTAPVFAAVTRNFSFKRRREQAKLATIYMACVLLVSLLAGAIILNFFGISLPALRIAGGLVIARLGFRMLDPGTGSDLSEDSQAEVLTMNDIAFTPIAMPLLSGPGSIAVTIGMATEADNYYEYIPIAIGIILVCVISWLALNSAHVIQQRLGVTGINALNRIMGFFLVCIGAQFVATGIFEALAHEEIIKSIIIQVKAAL